jgi:uncharacterized protein YecE (DUF72 family)
VIEVRDSSWNNPETLAFFAQKNVGFCNIDQPAPGKVFASAVHVSPPIAYFRLDGRNYNDWLVDQTPDSGKLNDRYNYHYKERELENWKDRIESVAENAQTTFVIFNNHFEAKSAVNALELKSMLTAKRVAAPPTLIQKYPELRRFADPLDDLAAGSNPQLPLLA